MRWCHFFVTLLVARCHCLDNGVAVSPPRGWYSGERFECNTNCQDYPDDCISEKLVRTTVDAMTSSGLKDAGYNYVILGDCWMNRTRDHHGNLLPDVKRFPGGMKTLAQYVHSRGMMLGVQLDLSNSSCHGYPGSYGNYDRDATTLATWGVDYVLATACHFRDAGKLEQGYSSMGSALNHTGRKMVYDCNWPLESSSVGGQPDYRQVGRTCNVYRTHTCMEDSWESLEKTIKYYADTSRQLLNYSHTGAWNIPNQLLVGDYGLSASHQYMQMAVWSLMNSPLLVSADVRHMDDYQRRLLLDKPLLAVDWDITSPIGFEVTLKGQVHIWRKEIQPKGSFALILMYFNISGGPTKISVVLRDIGIQGSEWYRLTDVTHGEDMGYFQTWYTLDYHVNPVSAVYVNVEAVNRTLTP